MNHLRERPEDYPVSTREDELRQQVPEPRYFRPDHDSDRREDQVLAELRGKALAARGHVAAQEHPLEKVGVRAASQKLSQLVQRAKGGETIVITVDGKVSAQLCPVVPRIDAKGEA